MTSILLLTYNGERYLDELLNALKNQRCKEFEVLAIDSSSTDGSREVLENHRVPFSVIPQSEFNHGLTRNRIAKQAQGDYLVFLSQDALPVDENWLSRLIKPLKDEKTAGVFGRQIPKESTHLMEKHLLTTLYPDYPKIYSEKDADYLSPRHVLFSNVNSSLKKSVWQKIPFPEVIMSEDQYWAYQVLKQGYAIVYEPKAAVFHSHGYGLKKLFERTHQSGLSLKNFKMKRQLKNLKDIPNYYLDELAEFFKQGKIAQLPYGLIYETVSFSGFLTGRYLPFRQI